MASKNYDLYENSIHIDIKEWIDKISLPRKQLDGMSVCPYARNVDYKLIVTNGQEIIEPPNDFEIIVYAFPDSFDIEQLNKISVKYNQKFPQYVFLPDHKLRHTEINGIQTNNGKHNLVLCQLRKSLSFYREKLQKTNYYTFWSKEYLEEILKI